ncbi:MAG TPA: dihydroxyacetone kinase subunit DhaK [Edaphobacter sp.]
MKKFINRPEQVVEEMLQGLVVLHPGSGSWPGHKVMVRADAEQTRDRQVAVISGGGSGHEPTHAGYIGMGMLSAGMIGDVITSPSSDSVFAAIKAVSGKAGALRSGFSSNRQCTQRTRAKTKCRDIVGYRGKCPPHRPCEGGNCHHIVGADLSLHSWSFLNLRRMVARCSCVRLRHFAL